jgi:PadR family transcriptional regulator PadR
MSYYLELTMNKQQFLGEFEHIVLLSVLSLKEKAYGLAIKNHLLESIDRTVAIGALYSTTGRLQNKGLLTSFKSEATPERGGKAKRYFEVTPLGREELSKTKRQLTTLWEAIAE